MSSYPSNQNNYGSYPNNQNYASQEGQPPEDIGMALIKHKLTAQELIIMKECNRESAIYRSLPLAGLFSGLTFYGIKTGKFKAMGLAGSSTKMFLSAGLGYFIGKLSYQGKCAQKFMNHPESRFGELLRKRSSKTRFQESLNTEPGFSYGISADPSPLHPRQQEIIEDHKKDLHNDGLDDYERGVTDSLNPYTELPPDTTKNFTTYEDMRRRNREEYVNRMAEKYRRVSGVTGTESQGFSGLSNFPQRESSPQPPQDRNEKFAKKNKYGDIIYE